jgi:hypothetical protein
MRVYVWDQAGPIPISPPPRSTTALPAQLIPAGLFVLPTQGDEHIVRVRHDFLVAPMHKAKEDPLACKYVSFPKKQRTSMKFANWSNPG